MRIAARPPVPVRFGFPASPVTLFLAFLTFFPPSSSLGESPSGYYAAYRASEARCLLVRNVAEFQSGDHVYGGPYPILEGLAVLRRECPVPVEERGEWFAVNRKNECRLVRGKEGLQRGDTILEGNLSRLMAEILLYEKCGSFPAPERGAPPPAPKPSPIPEEPLPPPQPAPGMEWKKTGVDWVEVFVPEGSEVEAKVVVEDAPPEVPLEALSPVVSITPRREGSTAGAVRVTLPKGTAVPPQDRARVALAFFEEGHSVSAGTTERRWRLHGADYDPGTDTWEATLHHHSFVVWGLVTLAAGVTYLVWDEASRCLLDKEESDHFVLHYKKNLIPGETVAATLSELEKARTFLTDGLGLRYPPVPSKLDVYYVGIQSHEVIYGFYWQGKTGGKWIDLNLPSNIPEYDRRRLGASLVHELFHHVQPLYQGNLSSWTLAGGGNHYGWLNEALSTAAEISFVDDPAFIPGNNDPILNQELYPAGLQRLSNPSDGYSTGLFFNFLTRRYGKEIMADILGECQRQVENNAARSAYMAVKRAVARRGRQMPKEGGDPVSLSEAWKAFSFAFLLDGGKAIDPRLNRKIPFLMGNPQDLSVSTAGVSNPWPMDLPPLSMPPGEARIFKVTPAERDPDGAATVDCTVTFTPGDGATLPFQVPVFSMEKFGSQAYIPQPHVFHGSVTGSSGPVSATLPFKKDTRALLLTAVPVGLGDDPTLADARAKGMMEVKCALRKKEEVPDYGSAPVSTSAIETYYHTLLRALPAWVGSLSSDRSHFEEFCPQCKDQLAAAAAEYAPKEEAMVTLEGRRIKIEDEADALFRTLATYIEKRFEPGNTIQDSDRAGISRIRDASQQLHALNLNCMFSVGEYMNGLRGLFDKGSFPIQPHRVESANKTCRANPGKCTFSDEAKLRGQIEWMREEFSRIEPCRKALKDVEAYWAAEKGELLPLVERLRSTYPWLR